MTEISPAVGWSKPESILRVVVLPAPLGPKNPTISPGATSKEMFFTASTSRVVRETRLLIAAPNPGSRWGTS